MNTTIQFNTTTFSATTPYLAVHLRSAYPMKNGTNGVLRLNIKDDYDLVAYFADHAVDTVIEKYMQMNKNGSDVPQVYVASDSGDVVRYLMFESIQFGSARTNVTASGAWQFKEAPPIIALSEEEKRAHINFAGENIEPTDIMNVFFDLWMLSNSVCVAHGPGGYGKLTATIGVSTQYCQINHQNVPWSYTSMSKAAAQYWGKKNLSSHIYPNFTVV